MERRTSPASILFSLSTVVFLTAAVAATAAAAPTFSQRARILAPDYDGSAGFGSAVSISGDTMLAGAPFDGMIGSITGAAYIFERSPGDPDTWIPVIKLEFDGDQNDLFGAAVALDGDIAVVGAYGDDDVGSQSGAVYVFQRDAGGADAWGLVAKLIGSGVAPLDEFGAAVAISGDTIVAGARRNDDAGTNSGTAFLFQRDFGGPDTWGEVARLTALDADDFDRFGGGLAIEGDTVVVNASENGGGAVYIYDRDLGGPNNWGLRLQIADRPPSGAFGVSVAIDGDTLAVGAAGSVAVYERDSGGPDVWGRVAVAVGIDLGPEDIVFGSALSLSGDSLAVGYQSDDDLGIRVGSAYVFGRDVGGAGSWGQIAKLTAADFDTFDDFGGTLAISGDTLVVGAPGKDESDDLSVGAAYVFREALVDPMVDVIGSCPGEWTIEASQGTALGAASVWVSSAQGSASVPSGPCAGTEIDLDQPTRVLSARLLEAGERSTIRNALAKWCGSYLQFLDETSCARSPVERGPLSRTEP